MNWGSWLLWGFAATAVLTTALAAGEGLGLSRLNLPYLLGAMLTPDRERAKLFGLVLHLILGWLFALLYACTFAAWGGANWWKGAAIGLVHAAFVLTVVMQLLPGLHPRMASEHRGPTVRRQLEPPGFLGLNYGRGTPIVVVAAHVVFGLILGAFYTLPAPLLPGSTPWP